jgi:serine/threonine-protein kinase
VLVDFGLGYKDGLTAGFQTEHGQEIGNRFLRLPELSSGSPLKQDVRTDLTFLGGLLFYMLTGSAPSALFDAEGKMPHQRGSAPQVLRGSGGRGALLLLGFFDRCFSLKLSGRFSAASEMKNALQGIKAERDNVNSTTTNDDLQAILSGINTVASRRLAELKNIYDAALAVIVKVHREIAPQVSPTYATFHTGYVNFSEGLRYDLGFQHFATQDRRFVLRFHIAIAGEEIVVSADDRVLYRTDANAPIFSEAFQEQVRKLFLSGLRQLVEQAQQAGH